jgi:type II secretory pathway pseudopilin PulG
MDSRASIEDRKLKIEDPECACCLTCGAFPTCPQPKGTSEACPTRCAHRAPIRQRGTRTPTAHPALPASHSPNVVRRGQRGGFTLMEIMLVGGMMSLLVLLISGAWRGLGRSSADAAARGRVAHEARLAASTLARDFSGSLPEQVTGLKDSGRLVGRSIVAGPRLRLCFDGEPLNGLADWGPPDTTVVYRIKTEPEYGLPRKRLVRTNEATGSEFTAAASVDSMALLDQRDGVKIELTSTCRDVTRTYTIVAKDPL